MQELRSTPQINISTNLINGKMNLWIVQGIMILQNFFYFHAKTSANSELH